MDAVFLRRAITLALAAIATATGCTASHPNAAAQPLLPCTPAQWSLGKTIVQSDGGPLIAVPVQAVYRSGARCQLDVPVTARLSGDRGAAIPEATATGTLRAVLGPAAADRRTPLTDLGATSFIWTNWCGKDHRVQVTLTSTTHTLTEAAGEQPGCLYPNLPTSFTWRPPAHPLGG